jgi:hypothetical protein
MSISPEPTVGREVMLHLEASSKIDAPYTTLTVTLSSGIELLNGDLTWQGQIAKDQTLTMDLPIRVITAGEHEILAAAFSAHFPGSPYGNGGSKKLYISSSDTSAQVVEDVVMARTHQPCAPDITCGTRLPADTFFIPITPAATSSSILPTSLNKSEISTSPM